MQHLLDLARPYAPLILALIVWPLVGAALSWWLWWDTPEHWEAYAKAHPGRALAIRALRTVSPHLRKLVVAWQAYAAARSTLPLSVVAAKQGALDVSATRSFDPTARQAIAPEVAAQIAGEVLSRDPSQRGSISLRGLLALLLIAAALGASLVGCPNWNRPFCPTPGRWSCVADQPHYCSPTRELTPIGDEPCAAQPSRHCAINDAGVAYCATQRADAAAD